MSIEDAIDLIGTGRFQRRIMVAAGLCITADAMEVQLLSLLSAVLKVEWGLTDNEFSMIFGILFGGAFLGSLTLGRLGDVYGRKPIFLLTASTIALFGITTSLVQNYHQLLMCRFFLGFGVGGITVPYDTLAEVTTSTTRGTRLASTSYFWTVASLLVPILAWVTLGVEHNWRIFVALCAVPCVVSALVGMYAVPESPRWLLQQGDAAGARRILQKAAIANGKDPFSIPPLLLEPTQQHTTVWDLISPEWRKTTLTLWCLWASYCFLYYGTVISVTLAFFKEEEGTLEEESSSYHFDYLPIIFSASAEVAGNTLVLLTVDRFGRINCISIYFISGGLAVFWMCMTPQLGILKILLAYLSRLLVCSGSNMVWILTPELLPTELRTTGHSAAYAVSRVGAFLAPFVVRPTANPRVIGVVMFLVSLLVVACARNLPETRGLPLGGTAVVVGKAQSTRRTVVPASS